MSRSADERRIEQFLSKYTPEMVVAGKAARARMRKRMPGGIEFVYDNYNALVFGFGKLGPQFQRSFIESEGPLQVSFGVSVLAALKQPHRIGFTVGWIFRLGRHQLAAQNDKQQRQDPGK